MFANKLLIIFEFADVMINKNKMNNVNFRLSMKKIKREGKIQMEHRGLQLSPALACS